MHLNKQAIFLSVFLAASPTTSPLTEALPADVKPTISRRSSPSKCKVFLFEFSQCPAAAELPPAELPPAQVTLTQDKCESLTNSTSSVKNPGYMSGFASADGLLIAGANCTVNVYTGLLCQGSSIGKFPVTETLKCHHFYPLIVLSLGEDLSNPHNFPGANSAKLTCP